jgi:hypothetical protein
LWDHKPGALCHCHCNKPCKFGRCHFATYSSVEQLIGGIEENLREEGTSSKTSRSLIGEQNQQANAGQRNATNSARNLLARATRMS